MRRRWRRHSSTMLTLVARGADGREALDVLDRLQSGVRRPAQVRNGRITCEIDEVCVPRIRFRRHHPHRVDGTCGIGSASTVGMCGASDRGRIRRRRQPARPRGALAQAVSEPQRPGRGARHVRGLERTIGDVGGQALVVAQRSAGLAEQMNSGIPAARYREQIARQSRVHPRSRLRCGLRRQCR